MDIEQELAELREELKPILPEVDIEAICERVREIVKNQTQINP